MLRAGRINEACPCWRVASGRFSPSLTFLGPSGDTGNGVPAAPQLRRSKTFNICEPTKGEAARN